LRHPRPSAEFHISGQERRAAVRGKDVCYDPVKHDRRLFCRYDGGAEA
jgi:hypothetical protein